MSQTVKLQRAYVTRRNDLDNSLWVQEEAERLALIEGDPEEAKRRRDAATDLKNKRRSAPSEAAYLLPLWLMRDLGGPRDPIAHMVKSRALTVAQGRTALIMREHVQGVTIDIQGNGDFGVFVQGGAQGGLEAWCDKRRHGVHAWNLALQACDDRARRATQKIICGAIALRQAYRLIGGDTTKASNILKQNVVRALNASTAYLGS